MLSQHDRRALADIESHLRASDPELARRLERPHVAEPAGRSRARRRISVAGLVLGLILLSAALAAHSADVAVAAFVVVAAISAGAALQVVSRLRRHKE